ncbi:aminoacylase [Vibrio astriarenae]
MMKVKHILAPASFALACLVSTAASAQVYDVVIEKGRVMDPETRYDQTANVGIIDDRIVTITEDDIQGKRVINAKGKVVAPGFIDTHWHWPRELGYKLGLRDGMTSAMDLEIGCAGTAVEKWYQDREGVTQMNYGCGVSHELARALVMDGHSAEELYDTISVLKTRGGTRGWSEGVASREQLEQIADEVNKGMMAGGINFASTLGYMRDGVTSKELYELQKVAASYGRHTGAHTRFTPDGATFENLGAMEVIGNAVALGAPVSILHFNNPGWELTQELIVKLRNNGMNIWGEVYPYNAGATTIDSVFLRPENWVEKLGNRYEDTMYDPEANEFYTLEKYQKTLEEAPTTEILLFKAPEADIARWISLEGVTMASDGMPMAPIEGSWDTPWNQISNGHPRNAGARSATLRLAREAGLPLMDVLALLSYNSAYHLGLTGLEAMQQRGRMQEGMIADIVVFDPENVRDNSTYANGPVPSTGFTAVLVSGEITVKDDEVLKEARGGQAIRHQPVKSQYQYEGDKEWAEKYSFSEGKVDFSDATSNHK